MTLNVTNIPIANMKHEKRKLTFTCWKGLIKLFDQSISLTTKQLATVNNGICVTTAPMYHHTPTWNAFKPDSLHVNDQNSSKRKCPEIIHANEIFYLQVPFMTHQTNCIDAYRRHRCWSHGVQGLKERANKNKFSGSPKKMPCHN